MAKMGGFN
jgi:acyl dehydratase